MVGRVVEMSPQCGALRGVAWPGMSVDWRKDPSHSLVGAESFDSQSAEPSAPLAWTWPICVAVSPPIQIESPSSRARESRLLGNGAC